MVMGRGWWRRPVRMDGEFRTLTHAGHEPRLETVTDHPVVRPVHPAAAAEKIGP